MKLQALRCTYKAGVLIPRDPELLKLEGWYKVGTPTTAYQEYTAAGSKLRFSRWLRSKGHSAQEAARLCKQQAESVLDVKLSCRYRDMLSMSETNHFIACTKAGRSASKAPAEIVRDRQAGILLCLDMAGKIKGRIVFRLWEGKVQLTRPYGLLAIHHAQELFKRLGLEVLSTLEDAAMFWHPKNALPGRLARKVTSRKERRSVDRFQTFAEAIAALDELVSHGEFRSRTEALDHAVVAFTNKR